jgi:hypothetical protein
MRKLRRSAWKPAATSGKREAGNMAEDIDRKIQLKVDYAVRIFTHYFKVSVVGWDSDCDAEVEEAIKGLVEVVKLEIKKEMQK